jgi:hypothetical protein
MRSLIACILIVLTLHVAAESKKPASDLYINVSLTRAERSKDSHSRRTNITVSGDKIVYERVYQGYRRNKIAPVEKEFAIKDEDVRRLENLVIEHNLLTPDSLELPSTGGGLIYFEILLDVRLGGKKSHIGISGPSKAAGIKDQRLYKDSRALLEEIFRIISAQDDEISYENDLVIETP